MTTRRAWLTTSLPLAAGLLCGCAQQGPFLAYRTNVSSLKTSGRPTTAASTATIPNGSCSAGCANASAAA